MGKETIKKAKTICEYQTNEKGTNFIPTDCTKMKNQVQSTEAHHQGDKIWPASYMRP